MKIVVDCNTYYFRFCRYIYILPILIIPILVMPFLMFYAFRANTIAWVNIDDVQVALSWYPRSQEDAQLLCRQNGAVILKDASLLKRLNLTKSVTKERYWSYGCRDDDGNVAKGRCTEARPVCAIQGKNGFVNNYWKWQEWTNPNGHLIKYIFMSYTSITVGDMTTLPVECTKIGGIPAAIYITTHISKATDSPMFAYEDAHEKDPKMVTCDSKECFNYEKPPNRMIWFACQEPDFPWSSKRCEKKSYWQVGGICYAYYRVRVTYLTARAMCEISGAQMVDLTEEKHKTMINTIDGKYQFWSEGSQMGLYGTVKGEMVEIHEPHIGGFYEVLCYY